MDTKFRSFVLPGDQPRPELDGLGRLLFFQLTAFGGYFTVIVLVEIVRADTVPDFSR